MRILKGFEFRRLDTPIHKLDPRTKLVYSMCTLVLALTFANPWILIGLLLSSLPFVIFGRVVRRWIEMVKGLLPFMLMIFALNLIFRLSVEGLYYALSMSLRFLALASTFSVLFLTTSPEGLALMLIKLRIPYEISLAFTMAVRFLPTLARDLQIIIDAQRARGLELERGRFLERIRRFLPILIPLIIFEIRRSFQIAEAMESRGFGAGKRTYLYEAKLAARDVVLIFMTITLTALLIALKLSYGLG